MANRILKILIIAIMVCAIPLVSYSHPERHVHPVKHAHRVNHIKQVHHVKPIHPKKQQYHACHQTTRVSNSPLNKAEKKVIQYVQRSISHIRYNTYKLGGEKIDTVRGIYIVDCSRYVDHVLKNTYPSAFNSLAAWSGTEKPTTYDFYQYFTNLSEHAKNWNVIEEISALRPGDILVFRTKRHTASGHVMIVMDKPIKKGNVYLVRISDAAPARHTRDTRTVHTSGIGIGTMLLKANPHTLKPHAYAWRRGAHWKQNVKFAMARPRLAMPETKSSQPRSH